MDTEGFAQAARDRHLVRKYTDAALPDDIISKLSARADANNAAYSLAIKLMANDGHGIPAVVKIFRAQGVKNYFILAGDDAPDLGERLGYSAADLMLYAQTLGLNSWYIGATYNHGVSRYVNGKKAIGIVVVGYGQTAGVPHKSKSASEISKYEGSASGKAARPLRRNGSRKALRWRCSHRLHLTGRISSSQGKAIRYISRLPTPPIRARTWAWSGIISSWAPEKAISSGHS